MVTWPWIPKIIEVSRVPRASANKASTNKKVQWTDRQSHPFNMDRYDDLNNDAEVSIALEVLTNIIAGVGFHTEISEQEETISKRDKVHPNKKTVDEYVENTNLAEKLRQITYSLIGKGFIPVELLGEGDVKLLPPETFYIWKNKKGTVYQYTQEIGGSVETTWKQAELDKILLFINDEDTSHPYGHALVDSIAPLVEARQGINSDMVKIFSRYASPHRTWKYTQSIKTIQDEAMALEANEDLFLGNVDQDSLTIEQDQLNPNSRFMPYIDSLYMQICEGLHAPLLLYLKNATEASANVMMESIDRFVSGKQRYIQRRVEKYLFEQLVDKPVPNLVWGAPKTGIEDMSITDISVLYTSNAITFNQVQHLLKQVLPDIPEPTDELSPTAQKLMQNMKNTSPKQPFTPEETPMIPKNPLIQQAPQEMMMDKIDTLHTTLDILENTYRGNRLTVVEAMREAARNIQVYTDCCKSDTIMAISKNLTHPIRALSPETESYFKILQNELLNEFKEKLHA